MFRIRPAQVEALNEAMREMYVRQVAAQLRDDFTARCARMTEEETLELVRAAIGRAAGHGLTQRYAVRLFVTLALVFGLEFDATEEWAVRVLATTGPMDQKVRAKWLYDAGAARFAGN